MFCYNCGHEILHGEVFCGNCGVKVAADVEISTVIGCDDLSEHCAPTSQGAKSAVATYHGLILTNLKVISRRLNASVEELRHILDGFILQRLDAGVSYRVVDAGDYTLAMQSHPRRVSLLPSDSWMEYQRLLQDAYFDDVKNRGIEPDFLFIIGDSSVIPMPELPFAAHDIPSIDSDLPYSYLYDEKSVVMICNGSIFQHPQHLFVGRLPLAQDATVADLTTYFNNASFTGFNGLPNHRIFGQSDPNWREVTLEVLKPFIEAGLMCDFEVTNDYIHRFILTSPYSDVMDKGYRDIVDKLGCAIYCFNQHSGNNPGINYFVGYERTPDGLPDNSGWKPGVVRSFSPEVAGKLPCVNIIMTEACFGGWHKRSLKDVTPKKKAESILLAALAHKTVAYVGSSRVAWGAVDPKSDETPEMHSADIIARIFLEQTLQGIPAGVALHVAKAYLCDKQWSKDPVHSVATICEFNLFGDPSLTIVNLDDQVGVKCADCAKTPMLSSAKSWFTSGKIYSAEDTSILARVRQVVDKSHEEINSMLRRHLYDHYGIADSRLTHISKFQTPESSGYTYHYRDNHSDYVVCLDKNHNITSVSQAKSRLSYDMQ